MQFPRPTGRGVSLLELIIALTVLTVVAAIASPLFTAAANNARDSVALRSVGVSAKQARADALLRFYGPFRFERADFAVGPTALISGAPRTGKDLALVPEGEPSTRYGELSVLIDQTDPSRAAVAMLSYSGKCARAQLREDAETLWVEPTPTGGCIANLDSTPDSPTLQDGQTFALAAVGFDAAIELSFNPPSGSSVFTGSCWTSLMGETNAVTATSSGSPLVVSGLENGVQYTCRVSADAGVTSQTTQATPTATTDPAPTTTEPPPTTTEPPPTTTEPPPTITTAGSPTVLAAAPGTGDAYDLVTVTWEPPTDDGGSPVTGYVLQRALTDAFTDPLTVEAATSPTEMVALAGNTVYWFQVAAINDAGTGPWATVSTRTAPSAPTAVAATPGTTSSFSTVSVSWEAPSGGSDTYNLQYSTSSSFTSVTTLTGVTSPLTVTGLAGGTTYWFRVVALNTTGAGPFSTAASALTAPPAPTITSVTGSNQTLTVNFTAAAGSGVSTYQYSTDNGATWRTRSTGTTASPVTITTRSGDNVALVNGTSYIVRLRAVNSTGSGGASNAVAATPITTPGAPNLTAATGGDRHFQLTWAAPASNGGSAITGYTIVMRQCFNTTGRTTLATVSGTTLSYRWDNPPNQGCYAFKVFATNAAGNGPDSNERQDTSWTSVLGLGGSLTGGLAIKSPDGRWTAVMQGDRNFVIYEVGVARWSTGDTGGSTLWMSTTSPGNLVIYGTSTSDIRWSTFGSCSGYHKSGVYTTIQNDGNLVTYNNSGQALWSRTTGIINNVC
jgi:prepilin-type N-terminal cleavage/methylation domain-containing protein